MKAEEARYADRIKSYQAMEIERVRALIAEGKIEPIDLAGPDAMRIFRFRGVLKDELLRSMNRTRAFAIGQVRDELRRQGANPR